MLSVSLHIIITIIISNQFSLICNVSRWFSFLNEVSIEECETGACQYHWCSIYRGLERVGSWVPGGSVGRDQLAMAAKVRRHWFNPCRLDSRGRLGANFSLLLYTDLIKKRKPSRDIIIILAGFPGKSAKQIQHKVRTIIRKLDKEKDN